MKSTSNTKLYFRSVLAYTYFWQCWASVDLWMDFQLLHSKLCCLLQKKQSCFLKLIQLPPYCWALFISIRDEYVLKAHLQRSLPTWGELIISCKVTQKVKPKSHLSVFNSSSSAPALKLEDACGCSRMQWGECVWSRIRLENILLQKVSLLRSVHPDARL